MSHIEKPFKVVEPNAKAPVNLRRSLHNDIEGIRGVLQLFHVFSAGVPEVMNQLLQPDKEKSEK